jgi:Spy/CpxP family protein refolding chaperone
MKKINKVTVTALSALLAIALAIPVTLAQTPNSQGGAPTQHEGKGRFGPHRGGHGGRMGMAFRKLNLTDAQKAQMKQIHQNYRERTQALRQELHTKMQALREANKGGAFNEALATQTLTETAPLRAKLMGERFKQRQEMMSVLTPEQKTQLAQMREEWKAKREEWKAKREQQQQSHVQ